MSNHNTEKQFTEAELLLPWYLNDTLSEKEQEEFALLLDENTSLQSQSAQERDVKEFLNSYSDSTELLALNTSPNRLNNLLLRIDQDEQQQEQVTNSGSYKDNKKPTNIFNWARDLFGFSSPGNWLTPANAVFALLLCVQLGFLVIYLQPNEAQKADFKAATVQDGLANYNDGEPSFFIKFSDETTYYKMNDFFNNAGIQILEGPTARNILTVWVKSRKGDTREASFNYIKDQAEEYGISIVSILPRVSEKGVEAPES